MNETEKQNLKYDFFFLLSLREVDFQVPDRFNWVKYLNSNEMDCSEAVYELIHVFGHPLPYEEQF